MSKKSTKAVSIVLGAAFATSLAASNIANAAGANPFAMTNLEGGYQVASGADDHSHDKKMEGKCGEGHMKKNEGKCGGDMKKGMKDGKCGGDMKKGNKDGKCGGSMKNKDGKCGGSMDKSKKKDGKCGEGKCGGK